MGCLSMFLELFVTDFLIGVVWEWLSSLSWRRRPSVPEREKPPRPDPPKRISRGGRR